MSAPDSLLVDDPELAALLAALLGRPCRIGGRLVLQRRWTDESGHRGRWVELVTLESGQKVIVKARNDRACCRESLFYAHVLRSATGLVPAFLGSRTTPGGVHVLALEFVDGRPPAWEAAPERALAMRALAEFHARFEGNTVGEVLPALAPPALRAEATPDPIEPAALHRSHAEAIGAEPLVLDPGDVRPENFIVAGDRVVLIDFENAAVRPRSVALASMLMNGPDAQDLLALYVAAARRVSRFPRGEAALSRSVEAARLWLAVRRRRG